MSEKTTGAPVRAPITTLPPPNNSVSSDSSATGDVPGVVEEFGDLGDQPAAEVNPKLEAALDAHRRGFDVIRLHYIKPDGTCSCRKGSGCPEKNRGKHPNMGMGWETQPPLSAPDIYALWEEQPDGNVGIRCGSWSNNLVVIDEDRAGALEEVAAQVGEEILGSYTVRSGSGNRHLYLSLPPGVEIGNADSALPQGVNVRCQGGQVVAPGSVTWLGSYSVLKDRPVLEAPAALIKLLTETTTVDGEVQLHQVEPADLNPIQQMYIKRAVTGELSRLDALQAAARRNWKPGDPGPGWGWTSYAVACRLIEAANAGGDYTLQQALDDFLGHAPKDANFQRKEALARWRSAEKRIGTKPMKFPATTMIDPLDRTPTQRGAANDSSSATGTSDPERTQQKLDHSNQAVMIAREVLAGRWAWNRGLGWLQFDGRRWRDRPVECVRDEIAEYYRRFVDDEERRIVTSRGGWSNVTKADARYLADIQRLLGKGHLDAVTSMAGPKLLVEAADFDAHLDLLNVANGVVDLRTGELRPHDPALLMRKITPVAYRPEAAASPDLARLLGCIPDAETRDWLQLRFGQAATGYVPPDDLLILLHGGGENGKSTLVGAAKKALGEYAVAVDDKVLLDESGAHSTERMDLFGARFGLTEEIPGGRELSMNKVKKIVGTPVLTARRMRCDPVEWEPTHALFVTTNTAPIVTSTDHGAWRRLAKVSFPIRYRKPGQELEGPNDRPGDPSLSARMHAGDRALLEAMLAWLVDGARRWYQAGWAMPPVPQQVVEDTKTWRGETDVILRFADEKLVFQQGSCVLSTDLYEEYASWAERENGKAEPPKTFKRQFLEHPVALTAAVSAARTTKYDGLSRPQRKATAYWPAGQQYVINNVAFLKPEDSE